jgi:hypothetical protein
MSAIKKFMLLLHIVFLFNLFVYDIIIQSILSLLFLNH